MKGAKAARAGTGHAAHKPGNGRTRSRRAYPLGSALQRLLLLRDGAAPGMAAWPYLVPLLAFALVISFCNIRSLDLWWHLKTGEWIWQNRAVPHEDVFSYTAAAKPWIAHEWLFGLLAFWVHRIAGTTGVVLARAALVALLLGLTAWVARIRQALPGATVLALSAAYAVSRMRFTERPELLSIPLALLFLLAYEKSRTRPAALALIPAAQLLWVNLHGGTALLGWVLAAALLCDSVWFARGAGRSLLDGETWRKLRPQAAACSAVVVISFLNPSGYKALFYGLLRTESPLDNKEFQSLAAMVRGGVDLSIVLFAAFAVLLIVLFFVNRKRVKTYEGLLLPFLLALTAVFFRFRPLFVFLLAPSLAWHLSQGRLLRRLRPWILAGVAALILLRVAQLERGAYFYSFGAGVHPGVFPEQGVDFLQNAGIRGNMFNSYGIGGYLIWRLGPEQKVFIDGREDVYLGPGVLEEYVHAFDSRRNWEALVGKYGIDYVVVRYPEQPPSSPGDSLDTLAFPRRDWALVYFDDTVVIYVRRAGSNEAALSREIKLVQPMQVSSYMDAIVRDPEKLQQFRSELAANAREHPASFRLHFTLGLLAVKLGPAGLPEALDEFRTAAEINPDFAPAHTNVGTICMHLGRYAEAREAFERSLALEPNAFVSTQLKTLR